ncbi:FeoB-associated Cys-rich membrane protein [Pseudodesulfovibrio sp. F-1]|uniref:FeoB-associated Cys-rich membrane protein n=1 Tax=Pseudodesulfovibrio alkaliphilus TaxID=2661613 RepID=A0A7K1KLJ3_9BACT|nr:FeoB-associated Cys-rich membrane protein [Pseudodesulfovibrio alkaliphilus]MUM76948.1 FeoB-associated Cys-rich membrane protein [Pseudodesulfovibrio alkaliphilus]
MLDTLVVGAIVLVAAVYVGRRIFNQFFTKTPSCGCSGCSGAGSCPSAGKDKDSMRCDTK